MKPGSAVEFTYKAEAEFEGERFHFKDRLWVDFNQGRFLFSDSPDEGRWQECSIAGNINEDDKIEIFPTDYDTFMFSIVLFNLTPLKSTTPGDCVWQRAILMVRGPDGHLFNDLATLLAILYSQDSQGVYLLDGFTKRQCSEIYKEVTSIIAPAYLETLAQPYVLGFLIASYCEDRLKERKRKLKLLAKNGAVLRNDDGELVDSVEELERDDSP
jgi:hypothetical protein